MLVRIPKNKDDTVTLAPLVDFRDTPEWSYKGGFDWFKEDIRQWIKRADSEQE